MESQSMPDYQRNITNSQHSQYVTNNASLIDLSIYSYQETFIDLDYLITPQKVPILPNPTESTIYPDVYVTQQSQILDNFSQISSDKSKQQGLKQQIIISQEHEVNQKQQTCSNLAMPLTLLIILTSERSMTNVRVVYKADTSNQKSIFRIQNYKFQNFKIIVFFIKTSLKEILELKIQYTQIISRRFWIDSKQRKEVGIYGALIDEEAAVLFPELTQKGTNLMLQNYCILIAQEHIAYNLRFFDDLRHVIKFYKIFKKSFLLELQQNKKIFQLYKPSDNNKDKSQFYLYFLYYLYRDKDLMHKLEEFQIFSKIDPPNQLQKIKKYRHYKLFGKEFQLFLYHFLFLLYINHRKKDDEQLSLIATWNILSQEDSLVKQMMVKVERYTNCFFKILDEIQTNNKIIKNLGVSFHLYLLYKIRYTQIKLQISNKNKVNEILIKFIDHLLYKETTFRQNHQQIQLKNFQERILPLFVEKNTLKSQIQPADLYIKLKGNINHAPFITKQLINILKAYILAEIPKVLMDSFETAIIPLVMKPTIPEENIILMNHFQKHEIKPQQLLMLINILKQMSQEEYNINTIEFIFIQFVAYNPHFTQDYLEQVIVLFSKQINYVNTTERYKNMFPVLCQKIIREIKQDSMKNCLQEWTKSQGAHMS